MLDEFVIYFDIPNSHEIKIHRISCLHYTKSVHTRKNSAWHMVSDIHTAINKAEELARKNGLKYRYCQWCKPSSSA